MSKAWKGMMRLAGGVCALPKGDEDCQQKFLSRATEVKTNGIATCFTLYTAGGVRG